MAEMMTVIVVGLGSIGLRHAGILRDLGQAVVTVSRRPGVGDAASTAEAVKQHPEALLLIATETADHMHVFRAAKAAGHRGPTVVEKPVAVRSQEARDLETQAPIWIAYNLRFSPVVRALRRVLLDGSPPLSIRMHAAQHLSTWRRGIDVKESYSALAARGGGVLRDLSHELDLVNWLWGPVAGLCALGGRKGALTIDSDDCWNLLLHTEAGADISLSLNYFDRPAQRYIHVTTATKTLSADLVAGTLSIDGAVTQFETDSNHSYREMWRELLSLRGSASGTCCTYGQALEVLALVEACERSAHGPVWVSP